jgi:heparosan-N-sulfate-glucuronate 5-epimerase
MEHQHGQGPHEGGWRQLIPMDHTYEIAPPWLSCITQGEGASLLARLHATTGEDRYAIAALRALKPMSVPVSAGGLLAELGGSPFVEEYPTEPPSFVLNGAIFALWGFYDVHILLGDAEAGAAFERLTDSLASNLWRYDTGHWSLYDLYPHPIPNVANPAYHLLHVKQLRIFQQIAPRPQFHETAERFEAYRASTLRRGKALGQKVLFRLVVPRNPVLAHRLPWNRTTRRANAKT